jgi:hypothetical protein
LLLLRRWAAARPRLEANACLSTSHLLCCCCCCAPPMESGTSKRGIEIAAKRAASSVADADEVVCQRLDDLLRCAWGVGKGGGGRSGHGRLCVSSLSISQLQQRGEGRRHVREGGGTNLGRLARHDGAGVLRHQYGLVRLDADCASGRRKRERERERERTARRVSRGKNTLVSTRLPRGEKSRARTQSAGLSARREVGRGRVSMGRDGR